MKKILYGNDAKEAILRGVEKIANAVNITLGPKGKNVALKSDLADLTDKKFSEYESIDEGFMTHKGEFLNREDAWKHAEECGQLSTNVLHTTNHKVLFSEDLY